MCAMGIKILPLLVQNTKSTGSGDVILLKSVGPGPPMPYIMPLLEVLPCGFLIVPDLDSEVMESGQVYDRFFSSQFPTPLAVLTPQVKLF